MTISAAFAKLAGIKSAVDSAVQENVSRGRDNGQVVTRSNFRPAQVKHYFIQAEENVNSLRNELPDFYGDFQLGSSSPQVKMSVSADGTTGAESYHYGRDQLLQLSRDIEQILQIRTSSQLVVPKAGALPRRVFISHGRSPLWRAVQDHIEKDLSHLQLDTLELAQEPSRGRTVIEKLEAFSDQCDSAVIVMTGDDLDAEGQARVRENVMHEIGFFTGKYGRRNLMLLHEEGVTVPSNLSGIVYSPFPKGAIESAYVDMDRELRDIYR